MTDCVCTSVAVFHTNNNMKDLPTYGPCRAICRRARRYLAVTEGSSAVGPRQWMKSWHLKSLTSVYYRRRPRFRYHGKPEPVRLNTMLRSSRCPLYWVCHGRHRCLLLPLLKSSTICANMRSQIYAKSLPMPMVIGALKRFKLLKTNRN